MRFLQTLVHAAERGNTVVFAAEGALPTAVAGASAAKADVTPTSS
jgi:hypothetical protein